MARAALQNQRFIRRLKKDAWGYLFLIPELTIFTVFFIYPVLQGLVLSMMDYNVWGSRWVGLSNFIELLRDELFWRALKNTTIYTLGVVPVGLAIALLLAVLIYPLPKGLQSFFKSAYYLPGVLSGVVVALTWKWIFDPHVGLLNYILGLFGLGPGTWLAHPDTALGTLVLMTVLGGQGSSVIILLANMSTIPENLYEAGRIDGATPSKLFWYITLPLLRPTILYLLVMGVISSYQVFDSIFVMTSGGPYHSTTTLAYLVYSYAFDFFQFGKASALAVILFAIVVVLSALQFWLFREK